MLGMAKAMPDSLRHTPMGLAVRALNERDVMAQLLHYLALLAEVGALSWAGVRLLRHQLRNGVVSDSARDASRGARETGEAHAPAHRPGLINLSAVQSREITLLSRDRNFLVQSLVLPLLIVGAQVLLGSSSMAADMWVNPNVLASVAFGLAAYSLSMSAFQTLNTEGHALWLLYTFPCSIESVLKDKAKLWGVMTLAYPLALFAIGAALVPSLDWKFFGAMLTALLGIPIYAFIAVALGVFGSNPLEQQQHPVQDDGDDRDLEEIAPVGVQQSEVLEAVHPGVRCFRISHATSSASREARTSCTRKIRAPSVRAATFAPAVPARRATGSRTPVISPMNRLRETAATTG
jgi:hypothetical protein